MGDDFFVAIGLVLVIEGALYALFPLGMKRMALSVEAIPPGMLRAVGLAAALAGVGIVWLIRR